ncbi:MAG TPA: glycosyltransferase [Desulfuromonadaceae bacterium]|jgi:glycosyltransferase involved in cell wall biosynthesis
MQSPIVDIIIPVWNNPFETRACLAAILAHSPEARLIVVDNGSSRETELMLEEFSEPLGDQGLFIKSDRNVGLIPAINIGLARSDGDFAVVLGPHVQVTPGWLEGLLAAARTTDTGIVSPVFVGRNVPVTHPITRGSSTMETFGISFSGMMIKTELYMLVGGFDVEMDAGEWCLKDYIRRAWNKGFHTCVTSRSRVICGKETVFGSNQRRLDRICLSRAGYHERWGGARHYAIYFGRKIDIGSLTETIDTILQGARQGHTFSLLLHRRQNSAFQRLGWSALHTGIQIKPLSPIMPKRDIIRQLKALKTAIPDLILVNGTEESLFPGVEAASPFSAVADAIADFAPNLNESSPKEQL